MPFRPNQPVGTQGDTVGWVGAGQPGLGLEQSYPDSIPSQGDSSGPLVRLLSSWEGYLAFWV